MNFKSRKFLFYPSILLVLGIALYFSNNAISANAIYNFPEEFTAQHYWISGDPSFSNGNASVLINYGTPNQNDKCLLTIIGNASNYVNFDSYNEDIAITAYNGEPRPAFDTIYQQKLSSSEEMIILSQKDQVNIYATYTNKYSPPSSGAYDGVKSEISYMVSCRILDDYSYADFQEEMVEIITRNMIVNPAILSAALKDQLKPPVIQSSQPISESETASLPSPSARITPSVARSTIPTLSPNLSPAGSVQDKNWDDNFTASLIKGEKGRNNALKIIGIVLVSLSVMVIIARQIYIFWLKRRNQIDDI